MTGVGVVSGGYVAVDVRERKKMQIHRGIQQIIRFKIVNQKMKQNIM